MKWIKRQINGEWVTLAQCRDIDTPWLNRWWRQYCSDNPGCVLFFYHLDDHYRERLSREFVARPVATKQEKEDDLLWQ